MLDVEIFRKRVTALWESQKRMAAPKKYSKFAKRAGQVKRQGIPIHFTKHELEQWLWKRVGLNAIPCTYCNAPIDILSLTLDHETPRSAGGEFALNNMTECCETCNERKGDLTRPAFEALLRFSRSELSAYDQGILLKRLKAAHQGAPERFFRNKKDQAPPPPRPANPPAYNPPLDFSGLGEF